MTIEDIAARVLEIEELLAGSLAAQRNRKEAEAKQRIRGNERATHGQNFSERQIASMRQAELDRRQRDPEYRARQEAKEREQNGR